MSKIELYDNYLDDNSFNDIKNYFESAMIPWYFNPFTASKNDEYSNSNFQFTHRIIHDFVAVTDPLVLKVLEPLLNKIDALGYLRIKANLNTFMNTKKDLKWHIDIEKLQKTKLKTAIFYINDNNGYTYFKENYEKIKPTANRLCIFDSNLVHAGENPTDNNNKIVININYIEK